VRLFSGFASEPAIVIAVMSVMSGGLAATGITECIGPAVERSAEPKSRRSPWCAWMSRWLWPGGPLFAG